MDGAEQIAAERDRVLKTGTTLAHDREHKSGELLSAARSYLDLARDQCAGLQRTSGTPSVWPWEPDEWKAANNPIQNLVIAGQFIAAEIDRLSGRTDERIPRRGFHYLALDLDGGSIGREMRVYHDGTLIDGVTSVEMHYDQGAHPSATLTLNEFRLRPIPSTHRDGERITSSLVDETPLK